MADSALSHAPLPQFRPPGRAGGRVPGAGFRTINTAAAAAGDRLVDPALVRQRLALRAGQALPDHANEAEHIARP